MLLVLATCLLTGTMTFVPPPEWTIVKIEGHAGTPLAYAPGATTENVRVKMVEARHTRRMTLQREFRAGRDAESP